MTQAIHTPRTLSCDRPRAGGVLVMAVMTFLLGSMGGAIVAAPLTLPLLVISVRAHPTRAFRAAGAIIGGLTAAEVVWAATYMAVGERMPVIWLLPLLGGLMFAALLAAASRQT